MDKIVMMLMSIVMPQDVPDVQHLQKMPSIEECWTASHEFIEHGLTPAMKARGALGVASGCMVVEKPQAQKDQEKEQEDREKM